MVQRYLQDELCIFHLQLPKANESIWDNKPAAKATWPEVLFILIRFYVWYTNN